MGACHRRLGAAATARGRRASSPAPRSTAIDARRPRWRYRTTGEDTVAGPATCWPASRPRCWTRSARARGRRTEPAEGAQVKVNMLLRGCRGCATPRCDPRPRSAGPSTSTRATTQLGRAPTRRRGRRPARPAARRGLLPLAHRPDRSSAPSCAEAGAQTLTAVRPAHPRPAVPAQTTTPCARPARTAALALARRACSPSRIEDCLLRTDADGTPVHRGQDAARPGARRWACPAATSSTAT